MSMRQERARVQTGGVFSGAFFKENKKGRGDCTPALRLPTMISGHDMPRAGTSDHFAFILVFGRT